eukprot:jgi/Chrzof1/5769/Cz16g15060.t1
MQASSYLNKLPALFSSEDLILITDPMLATGGTMMQVLDDLLQRGANPSNIRVVAVVAAPPALKKMADLYPGTYTTCIYSSSGSYCNKAVASAQHTTLGQQG